MDSFQESDAELLWSETLALLEGTDMAPSTLAMLQSCKPTSLEDETLYVATNSRFVQRNIEKVADVVDACLEKVAYEKIHMVVEISRSLPQIPALEPEMPPMQPLPSLSRTVSLDAQLPTIDEPALGERLTKNPLIEEITDFDSKLTFERFVEGEENHLALQAAKQVADGENNNYNPLFIYGKSGLGKTHLLRAIQNYIVRNNQNRLCLYKVARDFMDDYTKAMESRSKSTKEELYNYYRDVDVLIIDDIQHLKGATRTIEFFFDTFNYLKGHGKQIVLAADESPIQLGMGDKGFDERLTSRIDSGIATPIQVPDYELKLALVNNFYRRMKEDAKESGQSWHDVTISDENLHLMAERSGTNIRLIESFCQICLLAASSKQGKVLQREDIIKIANRKFPATQRVVTPEQVQKAIEKEYSISHADLVGSKRNKELMEPRHVAIWLTRSLTDITLEEIGKRFGGRKHATVKHSISWVDDAMRENRLFYDRVNRIKEVLQEGA